MEVGVKLRPSGTQSPNDPGHMGMYWRHSGALHFRGYRFYTDDLPEEFQDPSKWRDYLFENTVPGYVFQDTITRDDYEKRRDSLVRRSWSAEDTLSNYLAEIARPRQHGLYSFNPDTFDCDNCVTWAVETVNSALGDVLPRVRQGRIKLIKAQLEGKQ